MTRDCLEALRNFVLRSFFFLGRSRKSCRSGFAARRKWKRFGNQWYRRNSRTSERCVWSDPGQNGWFVELISRCASRHKHAQHCSLKAAKIVDTHSELRCVLIPGNLNRAPGQNSFSCPTLRWSKGTCCTCQWFVICFSFAEYIESQIPPLFYSVSGEIIQASDISG